MSNDVWSPAVAEEDIVGLGERLVHEFAGVVPAGGVLECVVRCHDRMFESGVRHGLVPATEAAVRVCLAAEFSIGCSG